MTSSQAKQIILVACFFAAVLASIKPVSEGKAPDIRIPVGAFLVAIMLLVLAEVQPKIAGAFGLLLLTSSLFAVGPDAYKTLSGATKGTK